MIEVHVILKPYGIDHLAEQIQEMVIINDMTHEKRPEYGNYKIEMDGEVFKVKNHKRVDGIWELIRLAIEERNKI